MREPWVIAEAGSCHEGEIGRALSLLMAARHADCDAVKFQFWSSAQRMRERRHVEDPRAYTVGSIRQEWLPLLSREAKAVGLAFMCTAYLPEDISVVEPYVEAFKISSFEATDREFIQAHEKWEKRVVISLGMGAPMWWDVRCPVTTLHCVSGYPVPLSQAGLAEIRAKGRDGYSDHTRDARTGAVAVGAGARVLEVHFRLWDTKPECPDYSVALTPGQLGEYVAGARAAWQMVRGTLGVQECERANMKHRVGV